MGYQERWAEETELHVKQVTLPWGIQRELLESGEALNL